MTPRMHAALIWRGSPGQLATVAGMRPGEIFGLTWGRVGPNYADIRQRVYKGLIDSPKTVQSVRQAALPQDLLIALEHWKGMCIETGPEAWVFPSERGTPLSRDNVLNRCIKPKLAVVGLGRVNFQVMRRTHSTLMNNMVSKGSSLRTSWGTRSMSIRTSMRSRRYSGGK